MPLRAKPPELKENRFKALVYANKGVGKTMFCGSFPEVYYIDTEGADKYKKFVDLLNENKSHLIHLPSLEEIIDEVKELLSSKHHFKTFVIDSISFPVHLMSNQEAERLKKSAKTKDSEGTEFGANLAKAKRLTFYLGILLTKLDMNVIVTAHEKTKYEQGVEIGKDADVNEKLGYALGSQIRMFSQGKSIKAHVEKSRYDELKSGEILDFNHEGAEKIMQAFGRQIFEKESKPLKLATPEQVTEANRLKELMNIPEENLAKMLQSKKADSFDDLSEEEIQNFINACLKKINSTTKEI